MSKFTLSPNLSPREWQSEALDEWKKQCNGVVRVVTGGGKTFFALFCIDYYLEKYPESRIIIIVPTVALMDQWHVELLEHSSLQEDEISLHGGGSKTQSYGKVCLMIINTARTHAQDASANTNTCLIVDECHRSATKSNYHAIDIAANATLGLSATPEREYDQGFEEIIIPVLGDIIYNYDYHRAKAEGVISDFELINLKVDMSEAEQEKYSQLTKSIAASSKLNDDAIPKNVLKRSELVACATKRITGAVEIVNMHKNEKIIIFHERIKEMLKIHSQLRNHGINALAYHSKQGPHLRRNNLFMFREGISNVLVTCKALDEGLNVPDASIGIIAASTSSTRQRIQRLGRILRPSGDKDMSTIYTIYTTDAEEKRLAIECVEMNDITEVSWMRGE